MGEVRWHAAGGPARWRATGLQTHAVGPRVAVEEPRCMRLRSNPWLALELWASLQACTTHFLFLKGKIGASRSYLPGIPWDAVRPGVNNSRHTCPSRLWLCTLMIFHCLLCAGASGLDLPPALLPFLSEPRDGQVSLFTARRAGYPALAGPALAHHPVGSLLRVRAAVHAVLERMARRSRKPGFVPSTHFRAGHRAFFGLTVSICRTGQDFMTEPQSCT